MDVIRAMIDACIEQNLTQKELAKHIGIDQADISELENGSLGTRGSHVQIVSSRPFKKSFTFK